MDGGSLVLRDLGNSFTRHPATQRLKQVGPSLGYGIDIRLGFGDRYGVTVSD